MAQVTVHLSANILAAARKCASEENKSLSAWVSMLIHEATAAEWPGSLVDLLRHGSGDIAEPEDPPPGHRGIRSGDRTLVARTSAVPAKRGPPAQSSKSDPRLFDTHVVVDWSARSKPSPDRQCENSIWWAAADTESGEARAPEYARTRHEAVERLAILVAGELDEGRRVLVGFDFPFGYPAGVAERLTDKASGLALWGWLAHRIKDAKDNANNRYEVAAEINRIYPGTGPFWGRPWQWDSPTDIPIRARERTRRERHPPERRIADLRAKGAKTVWQLAYAGSVGSQVLLGLPAVERLRADRRIEGRGAVWPFETGLRAPRTRLVFAEIYPSLLKKKIHARKGRDEVLDRAQVRVSAEAFARLDARGELAPLFCGAPCLSAGERRLVEVEEAWILGLGHEDALGRAAG